MRYGGLREHLPKGIRDMHRNENSTSDVKAAVVFAFHDSILHARVGTLTLVVNAMIDPKFCPWSLKQIHWLYLGKIF